MPYNTPDFCSKAVRERLLSQDAFDQTFGGSCVINPFGEIVAGPETYKETIVYGDIDLKMNAMAKSVINLTGSYSRWDILSVNVRENPYEPLLPMENMEAEARIRSDAEVEELKEKNRMLEEKLRAMELTKSQ